MVGILIAIPLFIRCVITVVYSSFVSVILWRMFNSVLEFGLGREEFTVILVLTGVLLNTRVDATCEKEARHEEKRERKLAPRMDSGETTGDLPADERWAQWRRERDDDDRTFLAEQKRLDAMKPDKPKTKSRGDVKAQRKRRRERKADARTTAAVALPPGPVCGPTKRPRLSTKNHHSS